MTPEAEPAAPESAKADAPIPRDFVPGLADVLAFTTEIAEPDRDGGALRYRGVDIQDLVAQKVEFGDVWALLVDGRFGKGLPPAEPFPLPVHSGDVRVDVQAGLAMLAPIWGYRPLLDIDDQTAREQMARASVMALSYVAQSARGRTGSQTRRGHRRILGVGRRARHERLHLHRPGDRIHRRGRLCVAVRCDRRDVRAAAWRRSGQGAADDRRGAAYR